jgi:hypothetical protein
VYDTRRHHVDEDTVVVVVMGRRRGTIRNFKPTLEQLGKAGLHSFVASSCVQSVLHVNFSNETRQDRTHHFLAKGWPTQLRGPTAKGM